MDEQYTYMTPNNQNVELVRVERTLDGQVRWTTTYILQGWLDEGRTEDEIWSLSMTNDDMLDIWNTLPAKGQE